MNWGSVPDWIMAFATLAMAFTAFGALSSWREQLRGTTEHDAALELATAAKTLRYHFLEARSPLYEAWEFPMNYHEARLPRTNQDEFEGWKHVYQKRWDAVWPHIKKIAELRPKVAAILGDDVANDAEELARSARMLRFYIDHVLEMKRVGPNAVAMWSDQKFVEVANAGVSLQSGKPDDAYSKKFDELLSKLLSHLRPHLQ